MSTNAAMLLLNLQLVPCAVHNTIALWTLAAVSGHGNENGKSADIFLTGINIVKNAVMNKQCPAIVGVSIHAITTSYFYAMSFSSCFITQAWNSAFTRLPSH
eukprot:892696-Pelagomonas_calceolata.AAC.1